MLVDEPEEPEDHTNAFHYQFAPQFHANDGEIELEGSSSEIDDEAHAYEIVADGHEITSQFVPGGEHTPVRPLWTVTQTAFLLAQWAFQSTGPPQPATSPPTSSVREASEAAIP
jgi:hypothetical protein